MDDRKLMQQALDALETADESTFWVNQESIVKALRERLAQPELSADFYDQAFDLVQRQQKQIAEMEAMLERQTARIVDLQTHIDNFDGEDR